MSKFSDVIPTILMIVAQITIVGITVLYKLALNDGMKVSILVAYRFLFGTAITPVALYFERNSRPKLTWKIVFQAFNVAFFGGTLAQNMYAKCMVLTSATFSTTLGSLIPALTFILAVIFRLESFDLKSWACRAKVTGTLICAGGVMLLSCYKGVEIKVWSTGIDLLHQDTGHVAAVPHHSVVGPLLGAASAFCLAAAAIFQAKISNSYPCHISSTALISFLGAIQSIVYALCVERNWSEWHLGLNIRLLTVAYGGMVSSGLVVVLSLYCARLRGPLFVSIFNPLMLVLVALAGSMFLDETLHLGSVLGGVGIIIGLYIVLWGKGKEREKNLGSEDGSSLKWEQSDQICPTCEKDEKSVRNTILPH